jgi:molybdopterin/thiamine biosynthesis adenylyltransferase
MTLVDGDSFESKNYQNQRFRGLGNKADKKKAELREEFDRVRFRAIAEYVTPDNITSIIEEGNIVFLAVDNYKTMSIVNARCQELDNVVLISGGVDELHDKGGDVCIYIRQEGKDITPDLTYKHPEVAFPEDRAPFELNCDEVIQTNPARLVTVIAVVDWMMSTFMNYLDGRIDYYELYFDTSTARVRKVSIPEQYNHN